MENGGITRKRRHKVIIHSSPFLRCVQTSVAISAGLAQNPGHIHPKAARSPAVRATHLAGSPRLRPLVATGSPRLAPIQEPTKTSSTTAQEQPENIKKSTVRVDAFLGEWLTPDYFEQITPPPSSVMMVAGAKADLLRREDYSNLIHTQDIKSTQGFPGGWGSPVLGEKDDGSLSNLSSLAANLPQKRSNKQFKQCGKCQESTQSQEAVWGEDCATRQAPRRWVG